MAVTHRVVDVALFVRPFVNRRVGSDRYRETQAPAAAGKRPLVKIGQDEEIPGPIISYQREIHHRLAQLVFFIE